MSLPPRMAEILPQFSDEFLAVTVSPPIDLFLVVAFNKFISMGRFT